MFIFSRIKEGEGRGKDVTLKLWWIGKLVTCEAPSGHSSCAAYPTSKKILTPSQQTKLPSGDLSIFGWYGSLWPAWAQKDSIQYVLKNIHTCIRTWHLILSKNALERYSSDSKWKRVLSKHHANKEAAITLCMLVCAHNMHTYTAWLYGCITCIHTHERAQ